MFCDVHQKDYESYGVPFIQKPLRSFPIDDPMLEAFPLVAPEDIDIVIVPMVAFDSLHNRLGYGGGNYDRFLPLLSPNTHIVGVAFTEQQIGRVPTEEHDRPLPLVISA